MKSEPIFQFNDVSMKVGELNILDKLNFNVKRGEFLSVLGASGAGKSSLLRMFNALSSPSSGQIKFRGKPIDVDIPSLRKNVGFLFQNPVVFSASVKENLLTAGRWNNNISQLLDHQLISSLEQVGLNDIKLTKNANDLSGGEQQRLALACTLLNKPQVLLLDEPTSNLDPKLAIAIMNLVEQLRQKLELTIIVVSHDHLLMRKYAKRVILLNQGQLIGDGTFKSLDAKRAFESAGLLRHGDHDET
jgi:ABC-type multidrug transport system ATPase subunit